MRNDDLSLFGQQYSGYRDGDHIRHWWRVVSVAMAVMEHRGEHSRIGRPDLGLVANKVDDRLARDDGGMPALRKTKRRVMKRIILLIVVLVCLMKSTSATADWRWGTPQFKPHKVTYACNTMACLKHTYTKEKH